MGKKAPYILATSIFMLLASCSKERRNPGYDYFPDMFYSPAYESFSQNPNFDDGKTMQPPVEGSMPMGRVPYPLENTTEDRATAGDSLENPINANDASLHRGKAVYQNFCASCHNDNGQGNGYLYASEKYLYPPPSLVNDKMTKSPDGEIYHVITVGYGVMGAHGPLIRPRDRWKAVHYVRNLQSN